MIISFFLLLCRALKIECPKFSFPYSLLIISFSNVWERERTVSRKRKREERANYIESEKEKSEQFHFVLREDHSFSLSLSLAVADRNITRSYELLFRNLTGPKKFLLSSKGKRQNGKCYFPSLFLFSLSLSLSLFHSHFIFVSSEKCCGFCPKKL